MPHILKFKHILCCPKCRGNLTFDDQAAACKSCNKVYPIRNEKIYFIRVPERDDELDSIKGRLKKRLGKYYNLIGMTIIAPIYPFFLKSEVSRFVSPENQVVVNIGCGNHRFDPNVLGIDLYDYDATDIICDVHKLPFKDNAVDCFVSKSVLEHIPHPERVVEKLYQFTKPGGKSLHVIPFLFPFHASPYDFQRFTHKGQQILFERFELLEQYNASGPFSLFLLQFTEILSILLSLGNRKVKSLVYLLLCGLTFPIKFLDFFFIRRKAWLTIAPNIFIAVQKSATGSENDRKD